MGHRFLQAAAAAVLVAGSLGAGCEFLGTTTEALTDAVTIGVINTTPYRAIFTVGAWEPQDRESLPFMSNQRLVAKDDDDASVGLIYAQTVQLSSGSAVSACRRAISIGSPDLIAQIKDVNDQLETIGSSYAISDKHAMVTGAYFSDAPEGTADEANPTVGTAEPVTVYNGEDYPCGSVVVFKLVEDASAEGGFRIDTGTIY